MAVTQNVGWSQTIGLKTRLLELLVVLIKLTVVAVMYLIDYCIESLFYSLTLRIGIATRFRHPSMYKLTDIRFARRICN